MRRSRRPDRLARRSTTCSPTRSSTGGPIRVAARCAGASASRSLTAGHRRRLRPRLACAGRTATRAAATALEVVAAVAAEHGGRFALCVHAGGCAAVLELPLAERRCRSPRPRRAASASAAADLRRPARRGVAGDCAPGVEGQLGALRPVVVAARATRPPGNPLAGAISRLLEVRRVPARFAAAGARSRPAEASASPAAPSGGRATCSPRSSAAGRPPRRLPAASRGAAPVEIAVTGADALRRPGLRDAGGRRSSPPSRAGRRQRPHLRRRRASSCWRSTRGPADAGDRAAERARGLDGDPGPDPGPGAAPDPGRELRPPGAPARPLSHG